MIMEVKQITAFQNVEPQNLKMLSNSLKRYRYTMGQPISRRKEIANEIQIILKGTARLIGEEDGKPYTITKLNRGRIIGLASILNADACEEVSAIDEIETIAIPDSSIVELYSKDQYFRNWCDTQLQECEIYKMCWHIKKRTGNTLLTIKELYEKVKDDARLHVVEEGGNLTPGIDETWFVSSGNIVNKPVGDVIDEHNVLKTIGPLPIRIVRIPNDTLKEISMIRKNIGSEKLIDSNTEVEDEVNDAPLVPKKSNIDLGQESKKKKIQLIRASGENQQVRACLQMMCQYLDVPFRRDSVEKVLLDNKRDGKVTTVQLCGNLASMLGLHAYGAKIGIDLIGRVEVPAIIYTNGEYSIITKTMTDTIEIASPEKGWRSVSIDEFEKESNGEIELLIVERKADTPNKKFGISWFIPILKKYRAILFQVFLASFIVQLFGLANPLLIQVIIDKVISQRSLDTLQVLGYALIIVTILGGILGSVRTFLFTETTNRIDTRLGSEVLDHLLRLPLSYFDKRPVGELGTRIGELEKIRNFLTGQALTTILDALFSVIYIAVMIIYSPFLTIVALGVVPIQTALTLFGAPLIRRQIKKAAEQNALTQSHLVEVLTGMQTVKAQNVEVVSRWKWQRLYNKYISRTFERTITTTTLSEISNVLQQLSQLFVLWVGSTQVLNGELTLGQLIAFRIISGYVTQPLLRLSSIWQSIQELKVSFERLSDIIDTPEESDVTDKSNIPLRKIEGKVTFENLDFKFDESSAKILNNVSLTIDHGTFVGVVGQSGSGKSTLMKLLSRLYKPTKGTILVDGYDISKVELYSLRRQIGIVPQDPLLFKGSVSENISLTNPEASSEEIIKAAKLADAHEFIMKLPSGYSTDVGERGSALSGGQRQRLAIARTILNNPRMLIMDEATSALDYKTERTVCENLRRQCEDKTVFFITHRLSTIKNADKIIMMHNGIAEEIGTHDELMEKQGRYFALYNQQDSN